MRRMFGVLIWLSAALVWLPACSVSELTIDGPQPNPTSVARADRGFPVEAVWCTDLGGTIVIDGEDFSPLPISVVEGEQTLVLPVVKLVSDSGVETELAGVLFKQSTGSLTADVPAGLAIGSYDVVIVNPNEHEGMLADSVQIVPPPELSGIVPEVGCNELTTGVTVSGQHFREAGDGTLPRLVLIPAGGSAEFVLDAITFVSATELRAEVDPGLEPGFYDLMVTNPEGCFDTLANAFEVVPPPEISGIEPVVGCNEMSTDVIVSGRYFRVESDGTLPTAALVPSGGGAEILLATLVFNSSTELAAVVPADLTPGFYDLVVTNPEGCTDTLANAFEVVPPPELVGINPQEGSNEDDVAVIITGNYFRAAGDGTPPSVFLTENGTQNNYDLENVIVVSSSELSAVVPAGIPVGEYDLTVVNPWGCSATLAFAYTAVQPPSLDMCADVDPAFGWVKERTKIEICASNALGNGLASTPEVFILIPDVVNEAIIEEIPLIREALLTLGSVSENSVMSAVVPSDTDDARIRVGGPYSIKVVNPDSSYGLIPNAFTLLPDPPPDILTVNPARGDKEATETITVTGRNFKTGMLADGTTPILAIAMLDETWSEAAICDVGTITVQKDVPEAGIDTAQCDMNLPATGVYLVRVQHLDDGSYDLYAAFAVTTPSGKLDEKPAILSSLNVPRRAHGVAVGFDDLGNRFVYAVGGVNYDVDNTVMAVLDSVEVSVMSNFGQLGNWNLLDKALPEPRTGLSLINVGRYLYAIGGSVDGDEPAVASASTLANVLRGKILGADTAPVIKTAVAAAGGSLAAGTWYYKVSAVMKDSTDNPLGETLPSDEEPVRVPADSSLTLTWTVADHAAVDHFRVYRSDVANGLSGTESLLLANIAVGGAETSWVDDGSGTVDTNVVPLPIGSLGNWAEMAELLTPRYDVAAVAVRVDPDHVYLYVSGGRIGPAVSPGHNATATSEWVALSADGRDLQSVWNAGTDMLAPRAEHVLTHIGPSNATAIASNNYLLAAGGSGGDRGDGDPVKPMESSQLDGVTVLGSLLAWTSVNLSTQNNRIGLTGIHVNNYIYLFNGWGGGGADNFANAGEKANAETTENCVADCFPDFSSMTSTTITFAQEIEKGVRYRSGLVFFGAFFYWVGGSTDTNITSTSTTVLLGKYSSES